ncbi:hypothetical protein [Streptomyces sp. NPDC051219]|uniref:hypothetical protein n=1 Tax=Streptomyces sp. NPDC051219 TaxID=3155283 RepID=UPI00343D94CA
MRPSRGTGRKGNRPPAPHSGAPDSGTRSVDRGTRALDRGATALDYLGMVVVVVALIAGIAATSVGGAITGGLHTAICRLFGGDCGSGPEAAGTPGKQDKDYEPTLCNTSTTEEKAGAEAKIAWFSFGNEYGFQEQEFTTPDGRTKVFLTFTDAASIGVKGSPKAGARLGKLGGEKVELGAGIKVTIGDTWLFNSREEAKELRDDVERLKALELSNRHSAAHGGSAGNGLLAIFGKGPIAEEANLRDKLNKRLGDQHITFGKIGLEGTGDLALKKAQKSEDGLALQLGGKLKIAPEATITNNNATQPPTRGYTYQFQLEYAGTAELTFGPLSDKVEKGQIRTGTMTVMRYADGSVARIDITQSMETRRTENGKITGDRNAGSGDTDAAGKPKKDKASAQGSDKDRETHVVTNSLTFPPPGDAATESDPRKVAEVRGNREIVENWLDGSGDNAAPFTYIYGDRAPDRLPAEAADDFGRLMFRDGISSYQRFIGSISAEEYGFEVNLGLSLGAKISFENSHMELEEAKFLGAPKADGTRAYTPYSYCAN